jgi:hypothetical protein
LEDGSLSESSMKALSTAFDWGTAETDYIQFADFLKGTVTD